MKASDYVWSVNSYGVVRAQVRELIGGNDEFFATESDAHEEYAERLETERAKLLGDAEALSRKIREARLRAEKARAAEKVEQASGPLRKG